MYGPCCSLSLSLCSKSSFSFLPILSLSLSLSLSLFLSDAHFPTALSSVFSLGFSTAERKKERENLFFSLSLYSVLFLSPAFVSHLPFVTRSVNSFSSQSQGAKHIGSRKEAHRQRALDGSNRTEALIEGDNNHHALTRIKKRNHAIVVAPHPSRFPSHCSSALRPLLRRAQRGQQQQQQHQQRRQRRPQPQTPRTTT